MLPLVTCVMPTYGRPDYVEESIRMFLEQDYPHKELIILNDCPGQVLVGDFPGVCILNIDIRFRTLGEKRNAIIEQALGEYIAVWDDDDVYLPWRLSYSIDQIQRLATPFYFPAEFWAYWGEEPLHDNYAIPDWISHPQVIFHKDLWRAVGGYPPQTFAEDSDLAWRMLNRLGQDWPKYTIAKVDRVLVMRGKSKYAHTSINGGAEQPDTAPRAILLEPCEIRDPKLRAIIKALISARRISTP